MKYVLVLGRVLFSFIFLTAIIGHFTPGTIQYASSAGVPYASFLVPLSGVMSFLGALSIILGYKAKIGAWVIILFLIPVTFTMHNFWTIADPMAHQMQMVMFMKNISMLGGALMIAYWGSGPLSLDNKVGGMKG